MPKSWSLITILQQKETDLLGEVFQGQGKIYKDEAGMACGVKVPKNVLFKKKKKA